MRYVLILLSHVYGGDAPVVVPDTYETAAKCETAGALFDKAGVLNNGRYHICIPAGRL